MSKISIDEAKVRGWLDTFVEINKLSVGENAICLPAEIDTAMDEMRQALADAALDKKADNARELGLTYEQPAPAQDPSPWCMKMNGCKTKCEDCPDEVPKQPAPAQPLSDGWYVMQIDGGTKKIWPMTEDQALAVALHGITKGNT